MGEKTLIKYKVKALPYLKNGGEVTEGEIEIDLNAILDAAVVSRIRSKHPGVSVTSYEVVK